MAGQIQFNSAKVLAFPVGGRKNAARAAIVAARQNDNRMPLPVVDTHGWYHEAAMAEDARDRNN